MLPTKHVCPLLVPNSQARGQLKSILSKAGVTDEKFLRAMNALAASLDDARATKGVSRVMYQFSKQGEFIALLMALVPTY
jgi:hypothetical protein